MVRLKMLLLFVIVTLHPSSLGHSYIQHNTTINNSPIQYTWEEVSNNVSNFVMSDRTKLRYKDYYDDVINFYVSYGSMVMYDIAMVESDFIHQVGIIDKNDLTYWQININQWSLKTLALITNQKEVSIQSLFLNAEYYASHIWLYNMTQHLISNGKIENLCDAMATYHNPFEIKFNYKNRVKTISKSCETVKYNISLKS